MSDLKHDIHLEPFYKGLEVIPISALAADHQAWWNQTLCNVNDCVVRLGVVHGDFRWHKHDEEDEFFYVLEGRFVLEFEDRTVELLPGMGLVVPRGVIHFPHAPERTVILMVEGAGVVPTGD